MMMLERSFQSWINMYIMVLFVLDSSVVSSIVDPSEKTPSPAAPTTPSHHHLRAITRAVATTSSSSSSSSSSSPSPTTTAAAVEPSEVHLFAERRLKQGRLRPPSWSSGAKKKCTGYKQRSWEFYLADGGGNWELACKYTPNTVNGKYFAGADRCIKTGSWPFLSLYGAFDTVPDDTCVGPYWAYNSDQKDSFRDDGCDKKKPGVRRYTSIIQGLDSSNWRDWNAACRSLPAAIPFYFNVLMTPTRCETSLGKYYGKFDVPNDIRCTGQLQAPSSFISGEDIEDFGWSWEDSFGTLAVDCPTGTYVTSITVRAAAAFDALNSFTCDDDTVVNVNVGGTGGFEYVASSSDGYCGMQVGVRTLSGFDASAVKFTKCGSGDQTQIYGYTYASDSAINLNCPTGEKIVGFQVGPTPDGTLVSFIRPVCEPLIISTARPTRQIKTLVSDNGVYTLSCDKDGYLLLTDDNKSIWASNGANPGGKGSTCLMQSDGNLVVYNAVGLPVWASNTGCPYNEDRYVIVQDDGTVAIYRGGSKFTRSWSSRDTPSSNRIRLMRKLQVGTTATTTTTTGEFNSKSGAGGKHHVSAAKNVVILDANISLPLTPPSSLSSEDSPVQLTDNNNDLTYYDSSSNVERRLPPVYLNLQRPPTPIVDPTTGHTVWIYREHIEERHLRGVGMARRAASIFNPTLAEFSSQGAVHQWIATRAYQIITTNAIWTTGTPFGNPVYRGQTAYREYRFLVNGPDGTYNIRIVDVIPPDVAYLIILQDGTRVDRRVTSVYRQSPGQTVEERTHFASLWHTLLLVALTGGVCG